MSINDTFNNTLKAAVTPYDGAIPDMLMVWLTAQGYTSGGLSERLQAYWAATTTPQSERNIFRLALGPPPPPPPPDPTINLTNNSNNMVGSQSWSGFNIGRAGTVQPVANNGAGSFVSNQWVSANATATVGDLYEVQATLVSGSVDASSAPFSTWLPLSTDRLFALSLPGGSFNISIRLASTQAVVAGPNLFSVVLI